jgi:ribosomal protein L11 methyltransferase
LTTLPAGAALTSPGTAARTPAMDNLQTASSRPLTREQAHALVDAVMDRELALSASAYEDPATGEWVFEATCDTAPDLALFAELARATLGGEVGFAVEPIDPEINWVAKSLEGLQPVSAGRFLVHGSHDHPVATGLTPIRIDAAQAFGTGHHETTSGCLEAIDRLTRMHRFYAPLDIGTGTGVLAIALAKRLHCRVIATDIDPIAVRTARENARDNGVAGLVAAFVADGLRHPRLLRAAPYDLIVANILAGPLISMAPAVGRAAMPGASVVLSGLLTTQALRVQLAYARQGMFVRRKLMRGAWTTLVLTKPRKANPRP